MLSERDASRMSLNIVACFINGAGVFTYLLMSNQALMVVMTGFRQQWVLPQRYLYWCHASAAALYVLCQMSSITYRRRTCLLAANTCMLVLRLAASMVGKPWMSLALFLISCALTAYAMHQIWFLINEAIAGLGRESALVLNLTVFRLFILVIWASMPIVWLAGHLRLVDDVHAEFLYIFEDVFMQGLFSSPLLYVSFLSMDQRRMNIRVLLEETRGNELVVSLKGAMAQKEEFLATMSYEMKTPLHGIIQLADQAAVMSSDDDIIKKANEIRVNGTQLQKLVNGILSRVFKQEHTLYMERKRVDVAAAVEEVITVIKPVAVRGVLLRSQIPPSTPHIFVDYNRLVQILVNVLGSYVKFTSVGVITVSADADKEPGYVAVSVTDSGPPDPGYGQDVLASFVTPGRWAWQGMRKHGPTLHDLGLRLTREMVRAMDGKLSVSSAKDASGTRVTFTLPVYDGNAASKVTVPTLMGDLALDGAGGSPWTARPACMSLGAAPASGVSPSKGGAAEGSRSDTATDAGDSGNPGAAPDGAAAMPEFDDGELSTDGVIDAPGGGGSGLAGLGRSTSCPVNGSDTPRRSFDSCRTRLEDDVIEDPLALIKSDGGASQRPTHKEKYGVVEILSVDDDPVNQMVIESMLLKMGFKVQQAMDGPEALDFLAECSSLPDLILLDVMMPRMSGYEVCAAVRKMFPQSAIPVIMVSAKSQEEDIVMGLKAGSNDYITKPFKRSEIIARINTQLRLQDMRKLEVNAARAHKLLHEMLPRSIIQRLQSGQRMIADSHADVTILFSDIVSFTTLASSQPTIKIIVMLNEMFSHFDDLVDRHKVFKVETVGDAYMVVGGHDGTPRHVDRMLEMARGMIASVENLKLPAGMGPIQIRVGMHTGPAYAGVIGKKCPRFCFFGDTVNTAARMESNGFPMGIHVSRATFMRARRREWLEVADREIKEKGRMLTYLLREGIYADMEAAELEKLLAGKASGSAPTSSSARMSTNACDATSIQLLLPNSPRSAPSRSSPAQSPDEPSSAPDASGDADALNSAGGCSPGESDPGDATSGDGDKDGGNSGGVGGSSADGGTMAGPLAMSGGDEKAGAGSNSEALGAGGGDAPRSPAGAADLLMAYLPSSTTSSSGGPLTSDKSVGTGADLDPDEELEANAQCGGGSGGISGGGSYDTVGLEMGLHGPSQLSQGPWGGQAGWAAPGLQRRSTVSCPGVEPTGGGQAGLDAAYDVPVAPQGGGHWGAGFQAADVQLGPEGPGAAWEATPSTAMPAGSTGGRFYSDMTLGGYAGGGYHEAGGYGKPGGGGELTPPEMPHLARRTGAGAHLLAHVGEALDRGARGDGPGPEYSISGDPEELFGSPLFLSGAGTTTRGAVPLRRQSLPAPPKPLKPALGGGSGSGGGGGGGKRLEHRLTFPRSSPKKAAGEAAAATADSPFPRRATSDT